ncbi:MAG: CHAT domain-containing tetratricopeptide repeat protein [Blastocatellia bacterium]
MNLPVRQLLPCLFCLALAHGAAVRAQTQTLQPGAATQGELSGGETRRYTARIESGQLLHVTAQPRGIDIGIRLIAPDGKTLTDIDIEDSDVAETASSVAEATGDYLVEVYSADQKQRGGFQLTLAVPRAATDADRRHAAALLAFAQAESLLDDGKPEALREAAGKYNTALDGWRAGRAREMEIRTLQGLGDTQRRLGANQQAATTFDQAAQVARAAGDRAAEGRALNALGVVRRNLGETQPAIDTLNQALALRREAKDKAGEAVTLNAIATILSETGDSRRAIELYNQLLPLRRDARDRAGEAVTLGNLGAAYNRLGEKRRARTFYEDALKLRRALKNTAGEGLTLSNIGALYSDTGELQRALDAYNQALPLRRDPAGRGVTLTQMGRAYDLLGAPEEAIRLYNQALELLRPAGRRREEAQALNFLGLAQHALGDHAAALETLNLALPIRREVKDKAGEAATLQNIGLVLAARDEHARAIGNYTTALALMRETGDRESEAHILNNLGFAYEKTGAAATAMLHQQMALQLSQATGDRIREANARYGLARLERARGRLAQGGAQIEKAIDIVQSLRARITSPELRASWRASVQRYYDLYIDTLMQRGRPAGRNNLIAEALRASEQARAQSLLELLREAETDIRTGVAPDLATRQRELQEQISDKTTAQVRLPGGKHTPEQATAAVRELETLVGRLRETQDRIRQDSPRYAALTDPAPLDLARTQQLLDPQTVALEYWLGEERGYVWAVTRTSIHSAILPGRAVIEAAARRYYEALTARNQVVAGETARQKLDRLARADGVAQQLAGALSRLILAPVARQIAGRRLLIVADGTLQFIPFGALPAPGGGKGATPLIAAHEIVTLPSLATLALLRADARVRTTAAKTIAVIADPVFETSDERVKIIRVSPGPEAKTATPDAAEPARILFYKSAKSTGAAAGARIARLPFTRREAETILSLVQPDQGKSIVDFAASRAVTLQEDLGQYRFLHIASHGLLNSETPELSGLVLSLVNEQGAPQNGFLLAGDLYNLRLPAAELVVLSACQTGLGRDVRGEGAIGLTRGLKYAGAPRVAVSLWNVSDQATAELMRYFYQGLLTHKLRPAAALRAAQMQLMKNKRWQSPFYWAPFVLQGEWQ